MIETLLVGGPLDGKVVSTAAKFAALDTPHGRYVRQRLSPSVEVYAFAPSVVPPPVPNRWARKVKPNPFPTVRA